MHYKVNDTVVVDVHAGQFHIRLRLIQTNWIVARICRIVGREGPVFAHTDNGTIVVQYDLRTIATADSTVVRRLVTVDHINVTVTVLIDSNNTAVPAPGVRTAVRVRITGKLAGLRSSFKGPHLVGGIGRTVVVEHLLAVVIVTVNGKQIHHAIAVIVDECGVLHIVVRAVARAGVTLQAGCREIA